MINRRQTITGAMAALTLAGTRQAWAAGYPAHPVQFIVPWAPGGGSDTLMRLISNDIPPFLGQPMPVINVPGVAGTVGLKQAAKKAPDGYTVTQVHEGLLVATATGITKLKWSDFDPIALMTASPQFIVVNAKAPYGTMQEFVDYVKKHPGKVTMGVTLGGVPHLDAAIVADAYGIDFNYVGYEGDGQRARALVGGNLDATIGDIASCGEFVKNGDLKFLAVGSDDRLKDVPDVPTFKEMGKDIELLVTRGIVMPKGAPQDVRDKMEAALKKLSEDANYVKQTKGAGADVMFRGQKDYRVYLTKLDSTVQRLAKVLNG